MWVLNRSGRKYRNIERSIDMLDYPVSCLSIFDGVLEAGDSLTPNTFELFSGYDDDEAIIDNYWESILTDLQIKALKKCKRLILSGEINPDQSYKIYLDLDNSGFVEIGEIDGRGSYVDAGIKIGVGTTTIGRNIIGGGGEEVVAYHYLREIKLSQSKFEKVKIKFVAQGLGYVSIAEYRFKDLRRKRQRIASKYRG
jgi:hypothetical protein